MNILRRIFLSVLCALALSAQAVDPTATDYSFSDCEGSAKPYPADRVPAVYPDSLVPVFINHVGRHGARYPSSAANCLRLRQLLARADSAGTITPLGRRLKALNEKVMALSKDRWGALDTLGMEEQAMIARRMFYGYTEVFSNNATIQAMASYSPRAMMSMYCFLHQLDRLNNRNTFRTVTGRVNSPLLRPFDLDKDYIDFLKNGAWQKPYDEFCAATIPLTALRRAVGAGYKFADGKEAQELAMVEYHVVAGLAAMGLPSEMSVYFTRGEANALWSCFNLRHYLQRTATTVLTVPADIASALVAELIATTDAYVDGADRSVSAILRFGHAETLMPLLSLLRIPGCYYLTNYFDTVASHWRDFYVVPMASNIQFILFRARESGRFYVRVDLNEEPVKLRKGSDEIYYPWGELRRYMENCIPLTYEKYNGNER